ncbi:MAG: hypothetical protein AB2672_19625 [Candidatus Thiodiazotropha endolucinida]
MTEFDDEATDGQMADYLAAELSGDNGAWNIGVIEYHCTSCKLYSQIVNDDLPSYYPLITAWHDKAAEGDTFSRFVFQYLAFIAHVKNNIFYAATNDRQAIQGLKRDEDICGRYLAAVASDAELAQFWIEVISKLKRKPLRNSSNDPDFPEIDKWWNNSENQPRSDGDFPSGKVLSLEDWSNMVEYWYSIRNNLFHGGKNPDTGWDAFLVEHAFQTLRPLMDIELGEQ